MFIKEFCTQNMSQITDFSLKCSQNEPSWRHIDVLDPNNIIFWGLECLQSISGNRSYGTNHENGSYVGSRSQNTPPISSFGLKWPKIGLFLKSKFALHLKNLMHTDSKIGLKVFLLRSTLTESTILSPKMVFKVFHWRKFVFQA